VGSLATTVEAVLRVGLDATPLLGPRTGVGQFTAGLADALRPRVEVVPVEMTWRGRRAGARPLPARAMRALWQRFDAPPIEWWSGDIDVMHGPNYVVPPTRRAAQVASVHDLTVVRFPELCTSDTLQYPALVLRAIQRGAHIHCDSRFIADEVLTWSGCPPERVHVVAPGIPTKTTTTATVDHAKPARPWRPVTDGAPFALALGTIEPRKDHATLLRAFEIACDVDDELVLVVAGHDGWGAQRYEETLAQLSERVRRRIIRLADVSDTERDELTEAATMLVYPSIYEGFGFPPLEAMRAATPVVATSAGSLPEVLGDAALFVPIGDSVALAEAMVRVHSDEALRSQLVARGVAHVAQYSWSRCADEMISVYHHAIDESAGT
jgi:glycosyltransferase involved in cell wall biosynthesis